jgi:hypothetical protein
MAAARERSERVGLSIDSLKSRYAFTQLQKNRKSMSGRSSVVVLYPAKGRLVPFLKSDKRG